MDDFILMPPPAPRFKRPRNNTTDELPLPSETNNDDDAAKPMDDSQFRELYCISPEDQLPFRSCDTSTNNANDETSPARNASAQEKKNAHIPPVSFRDIIGQPAAKLRLDEALLPLALPVDLVESVLTGE
jgi:hypothetical protein